MREAAAAAAPAPEVDALLAAHAAPANRKDAARARGAAEPVRLLEQLSRERSWRPPRFENDRVVWGPADAEARASQAPRCSTGDKKQLAALVALRSLDPDAVPGCRASGTGARPAAARNVLAAAAGDATGDRAARKASAPAGAGRDRRPRSRCGYRIWAMQTPAGGGTGRPRDDGQEVDQLKGRVVGRTVTWETVRASSRT